MNSEDKAVLVIQRIIDLPHEVHDVYPNGNEIYFKLKTYSFSLTKIINENNYFFYVYPHWNGTSSALSDLFDSGYGEEKYVRFETEKNEQMRNLCDTLYTKLAVKAEGVDDIFDDIINMPPF